MAVVANPFEITYNGFSIGGASSAYQILGPYSIERNYERLRVSFDALVVSSSYAELASLSAALENAISARDASLSIRIDGTTWTYTPGQTVINTVGTASKTANPETDRGFSRAYTVSIEAGMTESGRNGLREIQSVVTTDPAGIKTITISGSYTAQDGTSASSNYLSKADAVCSSLLSTHGSGGTFELLEESYTPDSLNMYCTFQRQYKQVIYNQSGGQLDDPRIKDHRVTMTDMWTQPGDASDSTQRLRRIDAAFDCYVVKSASNPYSIWESVVRGYMIDQFNNTFSPSEFAIEESRASYDQTSSRLMATMRFVFRSNSSSQVIESAQSVSYRESRNLDYTPVHSGRETDMYVDLGWASIERVWIRTVIVVGDEFPRRRIINESSSQTGAAGDFNSTIGGVTAPDTGQVAKVNREGWNIISSQSQVTEQYIGHPDIGTQFKTSTLTETIVERYNTMPSAGSTPGGRTP